MKLLFVVHDPPYGTERAYNALRHTHAMADASDTPVKLFLMADAVQCARRQVVPSGYYSVERMVPRALRQEVEVGSCGSCMDARALSDEALIPGVHRSAMDELSRWTLWADRVLVY